MTQWPRGLIDDSDRALIEAIGTTVLTQSVPDGDC